MIPAGTPGKNCTNIQVLTKYLTPHVLWTYIFLRTFVMRTSGSMNMMVSTVVSQLREVDPTAKLKRSFNRVNSTGNIKFCCLDDILRDARIPDLVFACRQKNMFTILSVNLWFKKEVWIFICCRQPS